MVSALTQKHSYQNALIDILQSLTIAGCCSNLFTWISEIPYIIKDMCWENAACLTQDYLNVMDKIFTGYFIAFIKFLILDKYLVYEENVYCTLFDRITKP